MEQKEVLLTFETIYELLRREKNKADIQQLDKEFYENLKAYLGEKQEMYEKSLVKTDIFSVTERPNIALQLHNMKKIIKELYEKREKKIIDLALISSKTKSNILSTENLLEQEKIFFEELISLLDKHREEFNNTVMKTNELPKTSIADQKVQTIKDAVIQEEKDKKNIEFTEFTDAFFGKELEEYGPYNKGDIAEIPNEIAQILINQKKAVEAKAQSF